MSSVRSQAFGIILSLTSLPLRKEQQNSVKLQTRKIKCLLSMIYLTFRKNICFKRLSFSSNSNF